MCKSVFNMNKNCMQHVRATSRQAAVWEQHFRIRSDGADILISPSTHTKKKGSSRSVKIISSPSDWANWEVKLICSQLWLHPFTQTLLRMHCFVLQFPSINTKQTFVLVEFRKRGGRHRKRVWREI